MRGELDKLPKRQLPDRTVGKRSPDDLAKLQNRLTDEQGMAIDIICDFLHGIPGFTHAAARDYLAVAKGTGAYARTVGQIAMSR
jgi:hypothetical protein